MARPRTIDWDFIRSLRGTMTSPEVEAAHGVNASTVRWIWSDPGLKRMRRLFGGQFELVTEPDAFDAIAAETGKPRHEIVEAALAVLAGEPTLLRNLLDDG